MSTTTFLAIMAAIAMAVTVVVVISSEPSCEQQGGHLVQEGVRLILVGKVMVHVPAYRCVKSK